MRGNQIKMKKTFYLGASVLALCAAASIAPAAAADMYRAPEAAGPGGYKDAPYVQSWTGFYLGVNGGYGGSARKGALTNNAFDDDTKDSPSRGPFSASSQAAFDSSGGFGGGQIGYNWQGVWHPHIVFGVEADIQGSGINGKGRTATVEADPNDPNFGPPIDIQSTADARSRLDWFGTVRGRLGYAFDRTLVYATGGFAFGHVDDRFTTTSDRGFGPAPFSAKNSATMTGFVVGGGLEYAITPTWSLKGEYQFIDLGSSSLASTSPNSKEIGSGTAKIDHSYNTVRAGLNYHLAPAYEPLK
jgi:outer membrane immunogenic protein